MAIHVVIPAAGAGQRMGAALPKQYLSLGGSTVLEQTLKRVSLVPALASLSVALAHDDVFGRDLVKRLSADLQYPVYIETGGKDRWLSVLNTLQALHSRYDGNDWVLVHDAVRPCVRVEDIQKLIEHVLSTADAGAILAVPVVDTLKRADTLGLITQTIDRTNVWAASTPQMFRLAELIDCLQRSAAAGQRVTDEASAMEFCGYRPGVVACHKDNIKITYPQDLLFANMILASQQQNSGR